MTALTIILWALAALIAVTVLWSTPRKP